jgi:hypothetical protein
MYTINNIKGEVRMFPVPSPVVLLGLALGILWWHPAMAQQGSDSVVVYEAARNKIGLIRYCRSAKLLDAVVASQAIATMESVLPAPPASETVTIEQGDRAQQAGEDGFWEVGRRRDLASVAKLFRTTPADLCQEWADETLRVQGPQRRKAVTMNASMAPFPSIQPVPQAETAPVEPAQPEKQSFASFLPFSPTEPALVEPEKADKQPFISIQSVPLTEPTPAQPAQAEKQSFAPAQPLSPTEPTPAEPAQAEKQPARATATPAVKAARLAPPPPLPEKAAPPPAEPEVASLPHTSQTGGQLASVGKAVPRRKSGTAAAPNAASGQPASLSLPPDATGALPRPQAVTTAAPLRDPDDKSQPEWEEWRFSKAGKPGRCLLAGCKWPGRWW